MKKKSIFSLTLIIILLLSSISMSFAQTGYQGYAIYRDGTAGDNWHTGILVLPSYTSLIKPIVHANGYNFNVSYTIYSSDSVQDNFLKGKEFNDNSLMGIYTVNGTTSTTYDKIMETADDLTENAIAYTFLDLCTFTPNGSTIEPSEINKMRCDGVVEYCYEFNDVVVGYGYDINYGDWWDISKVSENNFHSAFTGPKEQAENFMDFVE
jgi:hypothetical protein